MNDLVALVVEVVVIEGLFVAFPRKICCLYSISL